MGVESAGDKNHLRLELSGNRDQHVRQDAEVLAVAAAGRQRDVDRCAKTRTASRLAKISGARIVGELVGGYVEDRGIGLEAVLGAVAVVHVPVENQQLVESCLALEGACGDGDVVEQAEAHGAIGLGVVAGRTDGGQAGRRLSACDRTSQIHAAPGGQPRHIEALTADVGVRIQMGRRLLHGSLDLPEVSAIVHAQNLLGFGGTWLDSREAPFEALNRVRHGEQPFGTLRMAGRGPVTPKADILHDAEAAAIGHPREEYPSAWSAASEGGEVGEPACIAVTGLDTFLGQRLVERLLARPGGPRVLGIDLQRPLRFAGRIDFQRVDLTNPTADGQLARILLDQGVEVFVHLAFRRSPTPDLEYDHELETIGSLHVLNACAAAKLRRLVVSSSTMLYGARPDNPNFLCETHRLAGHPDAHCVQNRIEVENLLARWTPRHPDTEVTVLRRCWVMGPTYTDHVVRYFERPVVPTMMGYDPLLQFVHEEDMLDVFEQAARASHPGVFNVVGRGVLPLSMLLALAGKRRLPLPAPLLYRLSNYPSQGQTGDPPAGFYDYLRYLWVADGEQTWAEFGEPIYSTKEAWISLVAARRLERYR